MRMQWRVLAAAHPLTRKLTTVRSAVTQWLAVSFTYYDDHQLMATACHTLAPIAESSPSQEPVVHPPESIIAVYIASPYQLLALAPHLPTPHYLNVQHLWLLVRRQSPYLAHGLELLRRAKWNRAEWRQVESLMNYCSSRQVSSAVLWKKNLQVCRYMLIGAKVTSL